MVKKLITGMIITIFVVVLIGFLLPSSVHVERHVMVRSESAAIFPYLNNFRRFIEWSPWAMQAEDTQYEFLGPEAGRGAMMKWTSNHPHIGQGVQEIIKSEPDREVRIRLQLQENQDNMLVSFHLQPQGEQTKVTWGLDSDFGLNLLARYFGLFFDSWIGPEYERGLQNLKQKLEADTASAENIK